MVPPRERGPLHAARTPHYGDEVTSTLRPGSPRASTQSVPPRPRGQSPPHTPPGPAGGGKPASPVPLRSTAARPTGPRQPAGMLRTPPSVAAVFRSPKLPAHRAPNRPTTRSDATGEALREAVGVIGHLWLAPFASSLRGRRIGRACEQSGRVGSRCRLRGRRFKWNLFDARPLFHLSRRPTRRRRAPIGFAFAKSVWQRIGKRAASDSFEVIRARGGRA